MHPTTPSVLLGFQLSFGTVRHTSRLSRGRICSCASQQQQARAHQSTLKPKRGSLSIKSSFTKSFSCRLPQRLVSCAVQASAKEPLVLTEENVNIALEEVKNKLGSMFGNSTENRNVGITGDVYLASLDGPIVVLGLAGRFWHKREDVMSRISAYLMERIPEICEIEVEHPDQLDDADAQNPSLNI